MSLALSLKLGDLRDILLRESELELHLPSVGTICDVSLAYKQYHGVGVQELGFLQNLDDELGVTRDREVLECLLTGLVANDPPEKHVALLFADSDLLMLEIFCEFKLLH